MNKKKIAMFGCGNFARNHLRELCRRNNVVVDFLIDPLSSNLEILSAAYKKQGHPAPHGFNLIEDFLAADPGYDAGIIVAPPKSHYELALALLNAGKPVYVEKPFTTNVEDAKRLVKLAEKKGVDIVIGANRCVFPAYRAASSLFRQGEIGDMKSMSFYYKHRWEYNTKDNWRQDPSEPGSGLLADHSPHYSHFLFTDIGFLPSSVRHLGSRFNVNGVDVDTSYLMTDPEGRNVLIVMNGSSYDTKREEEIKIIGTEGDITIRFEGDASCAYMNKKGQEKKIDTGKAVHEIKLLGIEDPTSHPALIHNFVSLLCGYTDKNANPGKEGILPVCLTELVEKSRGMSFNNTLTEGELADLSRIAKNTGILNIEQFRSYHPKGGEITFNTDVIGADTK